MFGKPGNRKATKPGAPAHDDVVRRNFTAEGPNRVWLADLTEHRTSEGKLYLCAVRDLYSNRIVGYSISDRIKARISAQAVNNARPGVAMSLAASCIQTADLNFVPGNYDEHSRHTQCSAPFI